MYIPYFSHVVKVSFIWAKGNHILMMQGFVFCLSAFIIFLIFILFVLKCCATEEVNVTQEHVGGSQNAAENAAFLVRPSNVTFLAECRMQPRM